MIKIGNKSYYIDFDAISKVIAGGEEFLAGEQKEVETEYYYEADKEVSRTIRERTYRRDRQYDASKYEILNMMLQVVMNHQNDDVDDMLGSEKGLAKQPMPFKIAFNTLLYYKVLRDLGI